MPTIKTVEMSGAALDWAVLVAEGRNPEVTEEGMIFLNDEHFLGVCRPSTDWNQSGRYIKKYRIMVSPSLDIQTERVLHWVAGFVTYINRAYQVGWLGETPEIAICRAVVGNLLGAEVDVPAELLEVV